MDWTIVKAMYSIGTYRCQGFSDLITWASTVGFQKRREKSPFQLDPISFTNYAIWLCVMKAKHKHNKTIYP